MPMLHHCWWHDVCHKLFWIVVTYVKWCCCWVCYKPTMLIYHVIVVTDACHWSRSLSSVNTCCEPATLHDPFLKMMDAFLLSSWKGALLCLMSAERASNNDPPLYDHFCKDLECIFSINLTKSALSCLMSAESLVPWPKTVMEGWCQFWLNIVAFDIRLCHLNALVMYTEMCAQFTIKVCDQRVGIDHVCTHFTCFCRIAWLWHFWLIHWCWIKYKSHSCLACKKALGVSIEWSCVQQPDACKDELRSLVCLY